jgi:hypothetical protein
MTFGEPQSQPERDSKTIPSSLQLQSKFSPATADDSRLRSSLTSLHRQKTNVFTPSLDKKYENMSETSTDVYGGFVDWWSQAITYGSQR